MLLSKNPILIGSTIAAILAVIALLMYYLPMHGQTQQEQASPLPKNKPKNIVLIVADDLGIRRILNFNDFELIHKHKTPKGWSDLGYTGLGSGSKTPTIDRLARSGIILNQTYTYSMCTP